MIFSENLSICDMCSLFGAIRHARSEHEAFVPRVGLLERHGQDQFCLVGGFYILCAHAHTSIHPQQLTWNQIIDGL